MLRWKAVFCFRFRLPPRGFGNLARTENCSAHCYSPSPASCLGDDISITIEAALKRMWRSLAEAEVVESAAADGRTDKQTKEPTRGAGGARDCRGQRQMEVGQAELVVFVRTLDSRLKLIDSSDVKSFRTGYTRS